MSFDIIDHDVFKSRRAGVFTSFFASGPFVLPQLMEELRRRGGDEVGLPEVAGALASVVDVMISHTPPHHAVERAALLEMRGSEELAAIAAAGVVAWLSNEAGDKVETMIILSFDLAFAVTLMRTIQTIQSDQSSPGGPHTNN